MPYIYYPIYIQKSQEQIEVLIDSGSKVNVMNLNFARKLGFHIWKTNIRAQKIDGSIAEIFRILITKFQVEDKVDKPGFFQKTFLMADTKFAKILAMLFLNISNANVSYDERTFT